MDVLIVGCGYVGQALAHQLQADGVAARGTSRSSSGRAALEGSGIPAVRLDLGEPASVTAACRDHDAVVLLAAAGRRNPNAYHEVYLDGARHLAAALTGTAVRHVVQASTTGVYGQADGSWVDEGAPVGTGSARSRILAEAEAVLRGAIPAGVVVTQLRLGGIHGPGRELAVRIHAAAGTARTDGEAFTNLVHCADVVEAITAALATPRDRVYNVTDGRPVRRRELYDRMLVTADLPTIEWSSAPSAGLGKRVDNRRAREELGIPLERRPVE